MTRICHALLFYRGNARYKDDTMTVDDGVRYDVDNIPLYRAAEVFSGAEDAI
jgi:hypothetical protein